MVGLRSSKIRFKSLPCWTGCCTTRSSSTSRETAIGSRAEKPKGVGKNNDRGADPVRGASLGWVTFARSLAPKTGHFYVSEISRSKKSAEEWARGCRRRYREVVIKETSAGEKVYRLEFGARGVRLPGFDQPLHLVVVDGFDPRPLMLLTNQTVKRSRKSQWRVVESYLVSSDRNFHDLRGRIVLRPFPG